MGTLTIALKALFSSAKTTGTHVPLVQSDGTPDGCISMNNLASVLGVKPKSVTLAVNNSRQLGSQGLYAVSYNNGQRNALVSFYSNGTKIWAYDFADFFWTSSDKKGVYFYVENGELYMKNNGSGAPYTLQWIKLL